MFYVCECVAVDQFKPLDRPRESDRTTFVEAWGFGILVELNHSSKEDELREEDPRFPDKLVPEAGLVRSFGHSVTSRQPPTEVRE